MKWPFCLKIKIRFRDLDAMQHVNNAVYFTYMEQARTEYFMKLVDGKKISDLGFILASAKCDYKSSASIEDKLSVYVRPLNIGKSSWVFKYEIRGNNDKLVAEAETVQVAYDYKKKRKKRINNKLKKKLLEDMT